MTIELPWTMAPMRGRVLADAELELDAAAILKTLRCWP